MAVLDCPMGHIPGVFAGIRLKRISAVSNLFCRIDVPKVFTFCRRTSDGQIDLEGFDPRKKQDELFDLSRGIVFKDWTPQTIVVKNNFQSPLSPGFWFVPTNIHYIPDERSYARYSMSIEDVHPKNFWDSNTSTIQPTGQEYNSNITVLFRFRFDSKQLVLAAGSFSTPTGSKPWCKFIPTSLIEGLERSEPAIAWGSWRRLRERRVWNGFNTIDDLDNKVKHIIETHSQTASTKDQPAYSPMHLVGQSDWNEELSLAVRVEKKSILGPRNVCHSFEARYYTEPGNSTFTKTKLKKVETSTDIGLRKRGY
ncbi:hypothetical protein F5884DRAFT_479378 [Xylogone sp. PMI_703]|nr:hypothetical protein F5884DRAFT_479378 [Xylogone sp. PMI_703]